MEQSITMRIGVILCLLALVFGTSLLPAFAHGDEEHETVHTENTKQASPEELKRLETLVDLLNQLVILMSALKIQQGYAPVAVTPKSTVFDDHHDMDEMETHHAEHSSESATSTPVKELVIEVEQHNDKTHVHVRYVDKPEDMFFVTSSISDKAGIVNDINAKTGLSKEAIEKALKFM